MASTPLLIIHKPGRTLTADIYPGNSDTATVSGLTLTEQTNGKGVYLGTVTAALAGFYRIHVKLGSVVKDVLGARFFDTTDTVVAVRYGTENAAIDAGYPDRKIYIDVANGDSGAAPGVNGTLQNPVDNWADAKTLSGLLNITEFYVCPGSTLILSSAASNLNFDGNNYYLYPNGEDINGCIIRNAYVFMSVTGSSTTGTEMIDCLLGQLHLNGDATFRRCVFVTNGEHEVDGSMEFYDCRVDTNLSNPPIFDFQGTGIPANDAVFLNWSGDLRIKRLYAGSKIYVYGNGDVTIDADCTSGLIRLRGDLHYTDNVSGGFTGSIDFLKQPVNAVEFNYSANAAQAVQETHEDSDRLVVDDTDFEPTETAFETDGTDTGDNTFKGRTGTWFNASGSPANKGSFFISSSEGTATNANSRVKIFLDPLRPLTTPPAAGDVFRIIGARTQ